MPNTYTSNQSIIQIPENVKRVVVSMVGAGGAGEYINRITGTPSAGASATATTFLRLIAGGGQGGGIGGRNQGGAGGTASTPNYSYSGLTLSNGASGAVYTAGGNGGNGGFVKIFLHPNALEFADFIQVFALGGSGGEPGDGLVRAKAGGSPRGQGRSPHHGGACRTCCRHACQGRGRRIVFRRSRTRCAGPISRGVTDTSTALAGVVDSLR